MGFMAQGDQLSQQLQRLAGQGIAQHQQGEATLLLYHHLC
jgi:hypothetical protein